MSLDSVLERVGRACDRAGRDASEVTVVAVSKGHAPQELLSLYEAGHRDFGENRAQELGPKTEALPEDIRWHFVGPLQSNKVRMVRPVVRLLHSMDRPSLASAWMKGPGRPPPALLQVNIGREPQKSGVDPDDALAVCERFLGMGVPAIGVMTIPPLPERAEDSRSYFAELRRIRDQIEAHHPEVRELSMGMSDDFEVAIEEGATMIRVGRAIFAG